MSKTPQAIRRREVARGIVAAAMLTAVLLASCVHWLLANLPIMLGAPG